MRPVQWLPAEILLCVLVFQPCVLAANTSPARREADAPASSSSVPYPLPLALQSNSSRKPSSPGQGFYYAPSACPQLTSDYGYTPLFLPATGTGQRYAAACNSQTNSYSVASYSWLSGVRAPESTTTSVYTLALNAGTGSAPYTTLCDGFPRAHGTPTSTGQSSFVVTVSTDVFDASTSAPILPQCSTGTGRPTFPFPSPSCSIGNNDCASLYQSFVVTATEAAMAYGASDAPSCDATGAPWYSVLDNTPRKACNIQGNNVQLFYWPLSVEGGEDCPGTGSTITPAPQAIQTAIVDGTTLTSPTVYLSLDWFAATFANAFDNPNHPYTPGILNFTDVKLTLHSSSLSSFVSYIPGKPWREALSTIFSLTSTALPSYNLTQSAEPYDVANLDGPVPASAYFMGNPTLYQFGDEPYLMTIFDDYHPIISAPQQLRDIDSRLSACSFDIGGLYDPPRALSPAANFVTPTLTPLSPAPSNGPAPGQSPPDPPAPTATRKPQQPLSPGDKDGPEREPQTAAAAQGPPASRTPFAGVQSASTAHAAAPVAESSQPRRAAAVVLGTMTLKPGGPGVTLGSGANVAALDATGALLIDGSRTVPAAASATPVTIGGRVFTMRPVSATSGDGQGAEVVSSAGPSASLVGLPAAGSTGSASSSDSDDVGDSGAGAASGSSSGSEIASSGDDGAAVASESAGSPASAPASAGDDGAAAADASTGSSAPASATMASTAAASGARTASSSQNSAGTGTAGAKDKSGTASVVRRSGLLVCLSAGMAFGQLLCGLF